MRREGSRGRLRTACWQCTAATKRLRTCMFMPRAENLPVLRTSRESNIDRLRWCGSAHPCDTAMNERFGARQAAGADVEPWGLLPKHVSYPYIAVVPAQHGHQCRCWVCAGRPRARAFAFPSMFCPRDPDGGSRRDALSDSSSRHGPVGPCLGYEVRCLPGTARGIGRHRPRRLPS